MKKADITFTQVVYAVMALLVIVVCIFVFFYLTKTPLSRIWQIGQDTGNNNDDSWNGLNIILNSCKSTDTPKCVSGFSYRCNSENKWEKTEDAC
jgi:hypothetical protein